MKNIERYYDNAKNAKANYTVRKFIELEKNNLIVANFSLSFCNKNDFKKLWDKINGSILKEGYFVGNFFGVNDEWKKQKLR